MRLALQNSNLAANTQYPVRDLSSLQLSWDAAPGTLHTLIMYDLDSPYPENPSNSPFLHLLVVNVPNGNISQGQVIAPYTPPNPPQDSAPHTYRFDLYRQRTRISPGAVTQRVQFSLSQFIAQNALDLIASETIIANQDIFYIDRPELPAFVNVKHRLLRSDSTLSEREQAYCSCVAQVAAQQPGACNLEQAWFEMREGQECYNPFAICSASVGTTTRACFQNYDYQAMSDLHLIALANLSGIPNANTLQRAQLISMLRAK